MLVNRLPFDGRFKPDGARRLTQRFSELSQADLAFVRDAIHTFGFVLLRQRAVEDPRTQLVGLSRNFGLIIPHARSDPDGIALISPIDGTPAYFGTTSHAHPPHTDGSYSHSPPAVTLMLCIEQSTSGGETVLVSGRALVDALLAEDPTACHALFNHDAILVRRDAQTAESPVLEFGENRLRIRLRLDATARFSDDQNVQRAVSLCRKFLDRPASSLAFRLEPGEVLILDNWGVLHGRTAFDKSQRRRLLRLNTDGFGIESLGRPWGIDISPQDRTQLFLRNPI